MIYIMKAVGRHKLLKRLIMSTLSGFILAFWGCGTVHRQPWRCDQRADAAVNDENWFRALELHQELLAKEPHNCLARYHRGYIRGRLGDRQAEVEDYESAAACGYVQDDQLFFNLAMAYAELNQPELSLAAFQRAIALNPTNAENHFGWGMAAQSQNSIEPAIKAFYRAIEIDPEHLGARLHLVRSLLDRGRLTESRPHLDMLLQNAPQDAEVLELLRRYEDRRATLYDK